MTPDDKQIRDALDAFKYCIDTIRSPHYPADENAIWSSGSSSNPRITEAYMSTAVTVLQSALGKGSDERRFTQFIKEPGKPMKMLITNNWLKNRIENDPDLECGAGPAFITPDQQNPAPEDLLFRLEYWGNFEYKDGCEYAHQILLDYRDVIVKALTQPLGDALATMPSIDAQPDYWAQWGRNFHAEIKAALTQPPTTGDGG